MGELRWMAGTALRRRLSPVALARYALQRCTRAVAVKLGRSGQLDQCTYAKAQDWPPLRRHFEAVPTENLHPIRDTLAVLADVHVAGCFDILGSGWRQVRHGMACPGVEGWSYVSDGKPGPDPEGEWLAAHVNAANFPEARRVWRLITDEYDAIDWQRDFKSGWRYDVRQLAGALVLSPAPGVDVKVPWELARMHHLTALALAHTVEQDENRRRRILYAVRNQLLDFIATNPPGYGVNWRCTMDVAIRAANWLVAHDLLRADGAVFDDAFEQVFRRSIFEHGVHVRHHIEWHPVLKGNHYLTGLAGLIFVAAYQEGPESTQWLRFAWKAFIDETAEQFSPDGGHFESSTGYHRLVGETVLFATALGQRLRSSGSPAFSWLEIPGSHLERLRAIAAFSAALCAPDGSVPQIGDNDSGRFLKLVPQYRHIDATSARRNYAHCQRDASQSPTHPSEGYLEEAGLDLRSLAASIRWLTGAECREKSRDAMDVEVQMVRALAGKHLSDAWRSAPSPKEAGASSNDDALDGWQALDERLTSIPPAQRCCHEFSLQGAAAAAPVEYHVFADFGLYVLKSAALHLTIRCGAVGQLGWGAHAHNDQLSMTLWIDGEWIWRDPGSYLYTPLPAWRNRYRSAAAHHCPRIAGREPGDLDAGLFRLRDRARARCLYFGPRGFVGVHEGYGFPLYRRVERAGNAIRVEDFADMPPNHSGAVVFTASPDPIPYSPRYGCRVP